MHKFVLGRALGAVFFRCEARQSFFKNVDSKRVDAGHNDVNAKVKFVTVDEQGVTNVTWDDCDVFHVYLGDIVYEIDASAAW